MGEPPAGPLPDPLAWTRGVFLRMLGAVYFVAFLSLWVQVEGLIGSRGILPIRELLVLAHERLGPSRYWVLPTVFWITDSDRALHVACAAGVALAAVAMLGRARALVMLLLWALYLSLSVAGEDFLSFQWDALLLEAGLLAVWLAPRGIVRVFGATPLLVVWLYRWLLFRLMFASGVTKLRSGDPTWRSLTALDYHYETQPLPTWIGYYAHHLPARVHMFSAAAMFVIELVLPLLIWLPARWRLIPAAGFLLLQLLIAATGNYAFFNILTIALCVFLIEPSWLPQKWRPPSLAPAPLNLFGGWPRALLAPIAGIVGLVSALQLAEGTLGLRLPWPAPAVWVARAVSPLRSVNGYGLFSVMTTTRPEIIVEGSEDGETWRAYEMRYKPGDPARRPGFVAPHQPRLDWQMWFAALGPCEQSPWLQRLFQRLLEGSPPVMGLLGIDPFAGRPPRYVRALVYDYHFTDLATHRRTGEWWERRREGDFCPAMSLRAQPEP
jgi:lipase maturation factor 1